MKAIKRKMNCKDCIHYVMCLLGACINGAAGACPNFKDKSIVIELPCKVGDTVYCFAPCFDEIHHPKLKVVESEIVEVRTIATVLGLNFDVDKIGKTVFLTREEAEKALQDMRKESYWK